jgi:hypothetical protein
MQATCRVSQCYSTWFTVDRDSSVGIATRYGMDGPGIESRWQRDFLHLSRPALGPTQLPIRWVSGLSRGKGDRSVTSNTHPHLVPWSRKSRAIPPLPLWARVACYKVEPYLTLLGSYNYHWAIVLGISFDWATLRYVPYVIIHWHIIIINYTNPICIFSPAYPNSINEVFIVVLKLPVHSKLCCLLS